MAPIPVEENLQLADIFLRRFLPRPCQCVRATPAAIDCKRGHAGDMQIIVQTANRMISDRVHRPRHRIRCHRDTASQRLQLDDPECVGPAWENEDIRRSHGPNELLAVQPTEEVDTRISPAKRRLARTGADHDL